MARGPMKTHELDMRNKDREKMQKKTNRRKRNTGSQ
jgi:hypothetical protein